MNTIKENNPGYLDEFNEENFGYTIASPLQRLGAAIVQTLILLIPYFMIFGMDEFFEDKGFYHDIKSTLVQIAIACIAGAICYALWSANLGHRIIGLKVISSIDGSDQKKSLMGFARELLKSILGMFNVPSIWLLWDNKKQNLYDKITNTLVVKAV